MIPSATGQALPQHFARKVKVLIDQKLERLRSTQGALVPAVKGTILNLSESLRLADPTARDYPKDQPVQEVKLFARVLRSLGSFIASLCRQPKVAAKLNPRIQSFMTSPEKFGSFYKLIQRAINFA
jgi:hypothetical protein